MIGAERAGNIGFPLIGKLFHGIKTDKGLLFTISMKFFPGDQGYTNGTHNTGIRCPDHFFS